MLFTNSQVSLIFEEHAAILEVLGEDSFRIAAYRYAADSIDHLNIEVYELWQEKRLEDIPGVGEAIATHLGELFSKGRINSFETLKHRVPAGMFDLMKILSIGAKRAYHLAKELKLRSVRDLKKAAQKGLIANLDGFGEKSQKEILGAISEWENRSQRHLLADVQPVAEKYLSYLKKSKEVREAQALGSLRRAMSTVGDIDLAVATSNSKAVVERFVKYLGVGEIVSQGDKKATVLLKGTKYQVDLMTCPVRSWGALLQHFTGSKLHNIHLRKIAQERGWSLSEKASFRDEISLYGKLGLAYIPPELREDAGEIEAAKAFPKTPNHPHLPNLIAPKDIRGDLQLHSMYSDGLSTIKELAHKAKSLSYQYIAITDHAPALSSHSSLQINQWIENKKKEILEAEKLYPSLRVINGIEINIPAEGGLAYPEELLKRFDWVLVAIHSSFKKDKGEQTKRILWALKSPFVDALAHPTGRLLLERPSIEANWEEIYRFCAQSNKILEINAHPNRLDLPDLQARAAKSFGVKFEISTDSHRVEQMEFMPYGVSVARRGWLEAKDVVNTMEWRQFRVFSLGR